MALGECISRVHPASSSLFSGSTRALHLVSGRKTGHCYVCSEAYSARCRFASKSFAGRGRAGVLNRKIGAPRVGENIGFGVHSRCGRRRVVVCRGTKWSERVALDLSASETKVSSSEQFEAGPLLRKRKKGKDGIRESTCTAALASSLPALTYKTERTVMLPIDYYQVLGAQTHFLADAIVRAFEARVSNPPREGFSQEAFIARREILRAACETLADPDQRGDYNKGLVEDEAGTLWVDVPLSKVPGALCLLQEVGETEVVIEVGLELLEERLPKALHRDVVLAIALAQVERSREEMAKSPPGVVSSCRGLVAALKLLQDVGGSSLAPVLQEQIDRAIQQLMPPCILELLALPFDKKHASDREEGLEGLRSILWAVGEGGPSAPMPGFTREEFMREAFSCMKASEQVALFNATPSNIPADRSEVYSVALAHVAEGFVAKKPRLIQEADELFLQLQQTNVSASGLSGDLNTTDEGLDFALERGMCALLLGELDDCRAWLGLDDDYSSYRDPPIAEFVFSNSVISEEGDYLPGLCKLLESWLREVVFPSFRDTKGLQFKLGDYYDNPGVLSYLEKLEKGGSPLAAAAAIVQLGAGAGAALDSVKASALETLQRVFPLGETRGSSKAKDNGTVAEAVGGRMEPSLDLPHVEHTFYGPRYKVALDTVDDGPSAVLKPSAEAAKLSGDSWGNGEVVVVKESKLERLVPIRIVLTVAVFGALVFAGWRASLPWYRFPDLLRKSDTPSTTLTSSESTVESLKEDFPKMDARLAEDLVHRWQMAKAQALGTNHAVDRLSEALDGIMLKSWAERARDVAKNGWHWDYKLQDLSIDSVTISMDGRKATVEATLQESAHLYDGKNPEHTDSYSSTYTTRYELMVVDDSWKITGGAVLRS